MKVLITGASNGVGKGLVAKFLREGHEVVGVDKDISSFAVEGNNYTHYVADVSKADKLPDVSDIEILINCAGTILEKDALAVNIGGYVNVAEKYAFQPKIKSVLNIGSGSAITGVDYPFYCASQGARNSYTIQLANRLGEKYQATVNLLALELVQTDLDGLFESPELVSKVMDECILRKSTTVEDAATWAYFLTVVNKDATGQIIYLDHGESCKHHFVPYVDAWKPNSKHWKDHIKEAHERGIEV